MLLFVVALLTAHAWQEPESHKELATLLLAATRPHTPLSAGMSSRLGEARMLFGGGGGDGEKKGGMMDALKQAQGMFNPDMMKKYQEMGVKVQSMQQELSQTELEISSDEYPGIVMTISGTSVPGTVTIEDELAEKGAEAISAAVTSVAKSAHKQATQYATQKMADLYQELGLPNPAAGQPGQPAPPA